MWYVFPVSVVFFFFKIFFCKHFILKNHKAADKLEEYSDDRICPWHRVIWLHLHLTTHAPHFFLAQPFNIVAAITSRVFGWTEICYFSWCLSWRNFLPFPNYKEMLYVLVQYFKFYQALKLLGVHFCVMSRDHVFHGITLLNSF